MDDAVSAYDSAKTGLERGAAEAAVFSGAARMVRSEEDEIDIMLGSLGGVVSRMKSLYDEAQKLQQGGLENAEEFRKAQVEYFDFSYNAANILDSLKHNPAIPPEKIAAIEETLALQYQVREALSNGGATMSTDEIATTITSMEMQAKQLMETKKLLAMEAIYLKTASASAVMNIVRQRIEDLNGDASAAGQTASKICKDSRKRF